MKEMYLVYYEGESGVQHTLLADSHEEAKNLKKILESAGYKANYSCWSHQVEDKGIKK